MTNEELWAFELQSDCAIVVHSFVKEKIVADLEKGDRFIHGRDYANHTFGFRAEALVLWHNIQQAAQGIIAHQEDR